MYQNCMKYLKLYRKLGLWDLDVNEEFSQYIPVLLSFDNLF